MADAGRGHPSAGEVRASTHSVDCSEATEASEVHPHRLLGLVLVAPLPELRPPPLGATTPPMSRNCQDRIASGQVRQVSRNRSSPSDHGFHCVRATPLGNSGHVRSPGIVDRNRRCGPCSSHFCELVGQRWHSNTLPTLLLYPNDPRCEGGDDGRQDLQSEPI